MIPSEKVSTDSLRWSYSETNHSEARWTVAEDYEFSELIRRVRLGDPQAIQQLVDQYEPCVLKWVRFHLRETGLRRVLDSMDVVQAVHKSFFLRAAQGQYKLHTPDDLSKLLATMVRNKIIDLIRRMKAGCRDPEEQTGEDVAELPLPDPADAPEDVVAHRELYRLVLQRFSDEERRLTGLRFEECLEWSEIAVQMGGSAEGRRKQFERAIKRVAEELGVD